MVLSREMWEFLPANAVSVLVSTPEVYTYNAMSFSIFRKEVVMDLM